jgi:hypothetical protein
LQFEASLGKELKRPYLEKTHHERAQGEGSKPQYHKKKKKKKTQHETGLAE